MSDSRRSSRHRGRFSAEDEARSRESSLSSFVPVPTKSDSTDASRGGGANKKEGEHESASLRSLMVDTRAAFSSSKNSPKLSSSSSTGKPLSFRLMYITEADYLTSVHCGGIISSRDKIDCFCIKRSCITASHDEKHDSYVGDTVFLVAKEKGAAIHPSECFFSVENPDRDSQLVGELIKTRNEALLQVRDHEGAITFFRNFCEEVQERIAAAAHVRVVAKKESVPVRFEDDDDDVKYRDEEIVGGVDVANLKSTIIEEIMNSSNFHSHVSKSIYTEVQEATATLKRDFARLQSKYDSKNKILDDLVQRVNILERESVAAVDTHYGFRKTPAGGTSSGVSKDEFSTLKEDVDNIIDHVKVLNSRVEAGEALILGDFSFQSEAELLTFVTEEFPQYTFGVFYDVIALLDSINENWMSEKDYTDAHYSASKSKYLNRGEVVIATSCTHMTPMLLANSKADTGSSYDRMERCLGAMLKRSAWIDRASNAGIKLFIESELGPKCRSIKENIKTSLGSNDAGCFAREFVDKSEQCIRALLNWTEEFYDKMKSFGGVEADEAWKLVVRCWFAFFKDIRKVRGKAGGYDATGLDATSPARIKVVTKYIWALGSAMQVQQQFLDYEFEDHPSFARVVNHHLFEHRLPISKFNEEMKPVKDKLNGLVQFKASARRDLDKCLAKIK